MYKRITLQKDTFNAMNDLHFQKSGLSQAIGDSFAGFDYLPIWVLVLMLCFITAGVTEVTSNSSTATIFLPILAKLVSSQ